MNYDKYKQELKKNGYSILSKIYSDDEIDKILALIRSTSQDENSFVKTEDLFAIRQLIRNIPSLADLLLNNRMKELLSFFFESPYFLTKAIYFDKPVKSNWFVAYHQDLSISVNTKADIGNYTNWTFKKGQYGVQPPIKILQDTLTIRIHLDKTDKHNGALKVIPKSHLNGIVRVSENKEILKNEVICEVDKGGIMLMNPLTLHSSKRTTNGKRRRVIHLEFNKHALAEPLKWLEHHDFKENA